MADRPDHLRGLTIVATNDRGFEDLEKEVNLPPDARIYSLTLEARTIAEPIPEVLAILKLQDSTVELPSNNCSRSWVDADFPRGIAWPAFARLVAVPGTNATLIIWYGHCRE